MTALTVVLPVRDGEAYLDAAIASLRAQTFTNFDLLVIDDGSRDRTAEIASRHAAEDGRVQCLTNPASGIVAALNFGVERARAPLIARMDADDIALPERLERQMVRMAAEPDLLVLGTATIRIDGQGHRHGVDIRPVPSDEIADVLLRTNCIAHPTVVMRRAAVEAAGGYRQAYLRAEDYDLWLRLAERGRLANLPEPLLEYRIAHAPFRAELFSRQIMSEIAARAAAVMRRSGRPDPTGNWTELDAGKLGALGIDPPTLARETARRALHMARLCRKLGDAVGLREALALADRQARSGFGETARYLARRARVYL